MRDKKLYGRVCLICMALIAAMLSLYGCGSKVDVPDADTLALRLLEEERFTEKLELIETEVALPLYGLSKADVSNSAVYIGTGATAEETAVFEAVDQDAAQRVRKTIEAYIAAKKDSFECYIPKEVPKLEHAVIAQRGQVIVVCVSAETGTRARAVCKEYGLQ